MKDIPIYMQPPAGYLFSFMHRFSASLWDAGLGSVQIGVVLVDRNYNEFDAEKQLKGVFHRCWMLSPRFGMQSGTHCAKWRKR